VSFARRVLSDSTAQASTQLLVSPTARSSSISSWLLKSPRMGHRGQQALSSTARNLSFTQRPSAPPPAPPAAHAPPPASCSRHYLHIPLLQAARSKNFEKFRNFYCCDTTAQGDNVHRDRYQHGGMFPAINGGGSFIQNPPLVVGVNPGHAVGPSEPGYAKTETGCSSLSSFESMAATLKPSEYGIHTDRELHGFSCCPSVPQRTWLSCMRLMLPCAFVAVAVSSVS